MHFIMFLKLNYGQAICPQTFRFDYERSKKSFYLIFSKIIRRSGIIKNSTEQFKGQGGFPFASEIKNP